MIKLLTSIALVSFLFLLPYQSQALTSRRALADVNRDNVINIFDLVFVGSRDQIQMPKGINALADVNQDYIINSSDMEIIANYFDQTVSNCEAADINNNGKVDLADISFVKANQRKIVSSSNMPGDLNGDGLINKVDLEKVNHLKSCVWK